MRKLVSASGNAVTLDDLLRHFYNAAGRLGAGSQASARMTTQVTVVSTKGEVGTTIPAAAKVQESVVGPDRELDEGDPIEPTPMAVPIDRILEYDRNPRRARNEAYVEIETSIRRRGFVGMLPITRRPGEPHYRVAEGGNTVLRILKDLYEETQDPRFHTVQCLFEPWVSESETLIAHLVENDARGELLFIDRARSTGRGRVRAAEPTGTGSGTKPLHARAHRDIAGAGVHY